MKKIAVLISGGGTTLRNLLNCQQAGRLAGRVGLVIASDPAARGLEFARIHEVPSQIVDWRSIADSKSANHLLFQLLRESEIDLVAAGGFLKKLIVPDDFTNRIVNIHPSLIPAFCGRGFYGLRVHQAVLDFGCKLTGCTVHFVDNQYDHGPIIAQASVPVKPGDTAESLAARVFEMECKLFPETINRLLTEHHSIEGRRVIFSLP